MSYFEVTSTEVKNKASLLMELNQKFRTCVTELSEKEVELNSMWEGEANVAFHNAFTSDKNQMDTFNQLIDRYVEALNEIASKYAIAESRAIQLASGRSY